MPGPQGQVHQGQPSGLPLGLGKGEQRQEAQSLSLPELSWPQDSQERKSLGGGWWLFKDSVWQRRLEAPSGGHLSYPEEQGHVPGRQDGPGESASEAEEAGAMAGSGERQQQLQRLPQRGHFALGVCPLWWEGRGDTPRPQA